jgi:hypothetical protein
MLEGSMKAMRETSLSWAQVARRLDEAGIAWAVFAGAAATVYGATRPLTDVDILVPAAEGDRLVELFPEAQVKRCQDGSVEAIKLPGFDILPGLMAMDLDDQMAARLTRHEIAGVMAPVIPAEDNILLKAIWTHGPEVGKHDWEDVEAMMAHLSALDWDYLRWRAGTFEPQERVRQALQRLETLQQQMSET